MLSVPKNQIISVFLGIILLASVASFSPTPVSGSFGCGAGIMETRDKYEKFDDYGENADEFDLISDSGDYNFVMPYVGFSIFEDEDFGTVKFSYQVQAGGKNNIGAIIVPEKDIGTREIDAVPYYESYRGHTPTFAYGFELTRPAGEDYVTVTLFCDYSGGRLIGIQHLSVEHLTSESEVAQQTPEPVLEPTPTLEECLALMFEKKNSEARDCLREQKNLKSQIRAAFFRITYEEPIKTADDGLKLEWQGYEITMGPNSEIKVTLPPPHEPRETTIFDIMRGKVKAYSDKQSEGKFFIKTKTAGLVKRGTEFIVDYDPSSNITTVLLLEGTIDVTTGGKTVTFSDESKFIVDSSEIITTEPFSISEWNSLSDEIEPKESIISIPDLPGQQIISTTNIKLNAKEFTLPKNRYDQTQVVIKGIIDDYVRGVSVYVTVENPNGEAQEQKVMAADGHYMVTYLIHQDFTLGKYSVSTKYSGQVIDETTFVVSETVAQVDPGTPKDRQIPSWIKNNAKWWAEGKIGETDFLNGIEYMVKEKIIDIPDLPRKASTTAKEGVPSWIKNTASWWGNDLITEDDFASGIKWLVENGIIRIN